MLWSTLTTWSLKSVKTQSNGSDKRHNKSIDRTEHQYYCQHSTSDTKTHTIELHVRGTYGALSLNSLRSVNTLDTNRFMCSNTNVDGPSKQRSKFVDLTETPSIMRVMSADGADERRTGLIVAQSRRYEHISERSFESLVCTNKDTAGYCVKITKLKELKSGVVMVLTNLKVQYANRQGSFELRLFAIATLRVSFRPSQET